jgi:hypothetical protein
MMPLLALLVRLQATFSAVLGQQRLSACAPGLRHVVCLILLATTLAGCMSPEDGRPRGGGAGADVGNKTAQFKPESKVFTAAPSR